MEIELVWFYHDPEDKLYEDSRAKCDTVDIRLELTVSHLVKSRRSHSAQFKARIVMEGLAKTCTITELCQRNWISESLYYGWRKRFVHSGTLGLEKKSNTHPPKLKSSDIDALQREAMAALKEQFDGLRQSISPYPTRMSASEKLSTFDLVQSSKLSKRCTLQCIGVPRSSYYRWLKNLNETGKLKTSGTKPKHQRVTQREDLKEAIFRVMHSPPSDFGFNRTSWKMNDLQEAIAQTGFKVGRHSIRQIVRDAGYRWLKARKVLTSNDPDYREKLADIQRILSSLSDHEGFFSIDEYGPFAVKHRQGRKLVPPGTAFTVPQFQKSKGALIMTAALELSSNQVTHFYSKKKNTEEMIKLLDLLKLKYAHLDRIFLSWDAASWHVSKKLLEKIELENSDTLTRGGPLVELAPLPAGAQFLNVIEAIFSGMSRAIIHNSNYSTKDDAKAAIDSYFLERNEYFQRHPKKAGNMIWGKERSTVKFSVSNNCKDPRYR